MKENRYDDEVFFQKYAQMDRSQKGLAGAGEWPALQKILPDFTGPARFRPRAAATAGTANMRQNTVRAPCWASTFPKKCCARRERKTRPRPLRTGAPPWRTSISRTARLTSCSARWPFTTRRIFPALVRAIARWLTPNGSFVFSAEHPIFTAFGSQDWGLRPERRNPLFPGRPLFRRGAPATPSSWGEHVKKYHRTLTTYLETLLENGFALRHVNRTAAAAGAALHCPACATSCAAR